MVDNKINYISLYGNMSVSHKLAVDMWSRNCGYHTYRKHCIEQGILILTFDVFNNIWNNCEAQMERESEQQQKPLRQVRVTIA